MEAIGVALKVVLARAEPKNGAREVAFNGLDISLFGPGRLAAVAGALFDGEVLDRLDCTAPSRGRPEEIALAVDEWQLDGGCLSEHGSARRALPDSRQGASALYDQIAAEVVRWPVMMSLLDAGPVEPPKQTLARMSQRSSRSTPSALSRYFS